MRKISYEFLHHGFKFVLMGLLAPLCVLAQCENKEPKGTPPKPYVAFILEQGTKFKVKLDTPINSGNYKTGDLVQFSVIENVYGVINGASDKKEASAPDLKDKIGERTIVIAKDTKGYGKVDFSKRRFPLFLNGKARLTVTLDYVILESGDCIPVTVSYFRDERIDDQASFPQYVIDCRNIKDQLCIRGRRPNTAFTTAIISGGAAAALVLVKDATAKAAAAVTLIDQLSKQQGLSDLINGQNAEISDKLIFEVVTTKTREGSISIKPKS